VVGRGPVALSELRAGDRVLDGSPQGSALFIAHMHVESIEEQNNCAHLVSITPNGGSSPLKATPDHYIFVTRRGNTAAIHVRADAVLPGDVVAVVASNGSAIPTMVESVAHITECTELIAPLTDSGQLVIDSILASCYSDILLDSGFFAALPAHYVLTARHTAMTPLIWLGLVAPELASARSAHALHWYVRGLFSLKKIVDFGLAVMGLS
jgi:hypothetical protein